MVATAFSSTHPDVLSWAEEADAAFKAWQSSMSQLAAEYPDYSLMGVSAPGGLGRSLAGLQGNGSPGEGWRYAKQRGLWVPHKATRKGKALAARFQEMELRLPPLPGMPDTVIDGNRWFHPGTRQVDNEVWVSWGCPLEAVEAGGWSKEELDRERWQERRLSEYYAAIESEVTHA